MKTKYDIEIVYKSVSNGGGTDIIKNCSEYGTSNGGTIFYYVEKKKVGDMETTEEIKFINMDKIDNINITRRNIFETKKEKLEFIKSGGLNI